MQGAAAAGHATTPDEARQRAGRYRLMWDDVVYEPGELKVVAYDGQGRKVGSTAVYTAGKAEQLLLTCDNAAEGFPGGDLAYITVTMLDGKGIPVPDADDELFFTVSGAGRVKAACNGDPTALEPFTEPHMRLFHGKLVVIVERTAGTGGITLTVQNGARTVSRQITVGDAGDRP